MSLKVMSRYVAQGFSNIYFDVVATVLAKMALENSSDSLTGQREKLPKVILTFDRMTLRG